MPPASRVAPTTAACGKNLRDRFPHPYSEADAIEYISRLKTRPVQTSFGIDVGGQAIGSISLMLGDDIARRTAEVGFWIVREYWGHGIMVDAVRETTQYAFEVRDLVRVFALPFASTTRSSQVLQKPGYLLEGTMRHSAVKDGVVLDQFVYAAYSDHPLQSAALVQQCQAGARVAAHATTSHPVSQCVCRATHTTGPHP